MAIQEVNIVSNQVQVSLSGSIYVEDAAAILENLIDFVNKGHTSFLIDLSAVDYIDSSGIGALLAIHNKTRKKEGGVAVKGLNGLVRELFILTRVDKVFDIMQ